MHFLIFIFLFYKLTSCHVCVSQEPPTYEESVRQSLQSLQSQEGPFNTMPPSVMPQDVLSQPVNALPQYEELPHTTISPDSNNDPHPRDSD